MDGIDDDIDAIFNELGMGDEPFYDMISGSKGDPSTEQLVARGISGYRSSAQGPRALAAYIEAVSLNGGLGPYPLGERAEGRELRKTLVREAHRLVQRHGHSEMNRRAIAAARKDFDPRNGQGIRRGLPSNLRGFMEALGEAGGPLPETVFYSWQSDCKRTRNFIQTALEKAIKEFNKEGTTKLDPAPDRDTRGEPGSPDIFDVIETKIKESAVYVCDVSLVIRASKYSRRSSTSHPLRHGSSPRHSPNPNVLLETGFALAHKGQSRVICVINTAYGPVEDLPFDLRGRRISPFYFPEHPKDNSKVRADLVSMLAKAIGLSMKSTK